jgi:hypothetical protein
MTTGYVFKFSDTLAGILHYGAKPMVYVTFTESNTRGAIAKLSKSHAGNFVEADADQILWARACIEEKGAVVL